MSDHTVVFVCRHAAVNSLIVAPQFQRRAAARGLPARPRRVTRTQLNEAAHVVSFGYDLTAIVPG